MTDSDAKKPVIVGGSYPFSDVSGPIYKAGRLKAIKDVRILGAAAETLQVEKSKIKEMVDPYVGSTRKDFSDCAHIDPTLSEALKFRNAAFFKNGFTLELQLKSIKDKTVQPQPGEVKSEPKVKPNTAKPDNQPPPDIKASTPPEPDNTSEEPQPPDDNPNPDETQPLDDNLNLDQQPQSTGYEQYIQQLEDWADEPDIRLDIKMKSANYSSAVQGRSLTLLFPAISKLQPGQLPLSLKSISHEDIGNPVVDIEFWRLLAVRLNNLAPKLLALPEEMVYICRGEWADRKDSAYFGMSDLEASVQASKIYRKLINYDYAKAVVAGYMTKLFLKVPLEGMKDTDRATMIQNIIDNLTRAGTDVIAVEGGTEIIPSPVKVDTEMIVSLTEKLENLLIANGGSTKSQMGRTDNLNRDNATVQEIAFIKYRREPDEELIKTAFEDLLNKLLAHLAGKDFKDIPVRVIIRRKEPETDELASVPQPPVQIQMQPTDNNMEQKKQEIDNADKQPDEESLKQKDSKKKPFGA